MSLKPSWSPECSPATRATRNGLTRPGARRQIRRRTDRRRRLRGRKAHARARAHVPRRSPRPSSCALIAPSIVFGPTAGMSSLRSCPRLGAFTRTPARPERRSRPLARISATRASMASVPSAASIASTRPAATIAPCPASKVDSAARRRAPSAMSVSSSAEGARAPIGPNGARRPGRFHARRPPGRPRAR